MNHKLITLENLKKFKEKTIDFINSNMNSVICSTAARAQVKSVDMPGFVLYAGATIKVLFQNACTVSYPQLKVGNTAAKAIVAYRGGSPVDITGLKASSGKWRGASTAFDEVWQPYTTLELMYDGTNWVVMGDPVIENYIDTNFGYEKKASGLIKQWGDKVKDNEPVIFYLAYPTKATVFVTRVADAPSDDTSGTISVQPLSDETGEIIKTGFIPHYGTLENRGTWVAIGY